MIRLAVQVRREHAELALAELLALSPAGVEEVDLGDRIEYAVYGAPGELPALPELEAAAGDAFVEIATTEVADDWADRWRDFHEPIEVGGRLHVRAPWHPAPPEHLLDIVIDPGQAFGTGAHHTTRLCLELLLELEPEGGVVDVGCGSGVLAIAAAKLGFAPVRALDHERESVAAATENAAVNGVQVAVWRQDLLHDGPAPGAPTVLANLLRPLLLRVAQDGFAPGTPAPRALIASGLLLHEADAVAAAFAERHGLFVIIALGESLIVAGTAVASDERTPELIAAAGAALIVACLLWWTYFGWLKEALQDGLRATPAHDVGRVARDAFSLAHFALVCGIVGFAVAVEEIVAHPDEGLHSEVTLALGSGVALFVGFSAFALWRARGILLVPRLALLVATLVGVAVVPDSSPVWPLAALALGLLVVIVSEELRRPATDAGGEVGIDDLSRDPGVDAAAPGRGGAPAGQP